MIGLDGECRTDDEAMRELAALIFTESPAAENAWYDDIKRQLAGTARS